MPVVKFNHIKKEQEELRVHNTITSIYYGLGTMRDLLGSIEDIIFALEQQTFTLPQCEETDYILNTLEELHTTMCSEPIEFAELHNEVTDLFVGRKNLK